MKKTTKILAMVMAFALVVGILPQTVFAGAGVGTSLTGDEVAIETAANQLVTDTNSGKYKLLSTAKLKKLIDKKADIVIVDTMPAAFDAKYRIPGAINVEVGLTEITSAQKKALLSAVKKACKVTTTNKKTGKKTTKVDYSKKVVVYCGFVGCRRSHFAAAYLVSKGFKNVYRQSGGISAWIDAGYATEGTGDVTESTETTTETTESTENTESTQTPEPTEAAQ